MELPDLPKHSSLIEALRREVESSDWWRWLELGCSLAAGRGDEQSDVDVAVGHRLMNGPELEAAGNALVRGIGSPSGVLVHAEASWPEHIIRFAVEYETGVQLDLVLMPADHRPGLPDGSVAVVDKDGLLADVWTPPVAEATAEQARQWTMLGWWALSNVAKYVRRTSLFEAIDALTDARTQALRLFAVGRGIPYAAFGLTSLLDFEPFEVPDRLAVTYAGPSDPDAVLDAAWAVWDLLDAAASAAAAELDVDLTTAWADIARARLRAADSRTEA